ncbi:MAG: rRNA large subunit methyltransferase I [Sandaracinus sp.]|nr:rRNA large subunit methyltransferase I [Myxococcales bacterium]MAT29177.1 rRNA large subunit methyltransferase I [Sandaracinus sp.]
MWAGHPWVFAQAIERVDGAPGRGDPVRVRDPEGKFLGAGFYTPESAIPIRLVTRDPDEPLDEAALARRIERAARYRRETLGFPTEATTGFRMIHAEGDGLPGLVADVFGDVVVAQIGTAGMKRREDVLFGHLQRVTGAKTIVRTANRVKAEHIDDEWSVVRGPEPKALRFRERGFEYEVPIQLTQKTGYYFDQRDNRARVEAFAHGRVLDAYSYLGSMGLAAARGRAESVLSVDSSAPVVAAGATIAHHNGLADRIEFRRDDIRKILPVLAQRGERFDVVIVDPPKLVPTRKHLERGRRAYVELNRLAAKLLEPGGLLVSCSCSAAMRPGDLLRAVNLGARKAGKHLTLVDMGAQGADHPTPAAFPEGRYLKAMFLRVDA